MTTLRWFSALALCLLALPVLLAQSSASLSSITQSSASLSSIAQSSASSASSSIAESSSSSFAQSSASYSSSIARPASSSSSFALVASDSGPGTDEAFRPLPEAPMPAAAFISAGPAISFAAPCRTGASRRGRPDVDYADYADYAHQARQPCLEAANPYARFLNTTTPVPLTPEQKAHLALHNLKDPGNLATIVGTAGFTVGTNAHTAYGPGWKGFGRNAGYSLLQDTTGEFFGTFLIPSLTHEDPHYHRMPHAGMARRALHAISRTVVAQSDQGTLMPNFASLLTNPICAEISNLYVPGVNDNGPSTIARIMTGYATEPVDNLITEFMPDLARHIHVRVIFVQRLLNPVSSDQYILP